MGLRQDLSGSALPVILPSVSSRARISGLIGSPLLRPVRLLAPLDGSDRALPQPRGLLHPGFQRVSLLSRCWILLRQSLDSLSVGLSPTGIAASFAAPDPISAPLPPNASSEWRPSLPACSAFVASSCVRSVILTDERLLHFQLGQDRVCRSRLRCKEAAEEQPQKQSFACKKCNET